VTSSRAQHLARVLRERRAVERDQLGLPHSREMQIGRAEIANHRPRVCFLRLLTDGRAAFLVRNAR
jgi:hypothetical protein